MESAKQLGSTEASVRASAIQAMGLSGEIGARRVLEAFNSGNLYMLDGKMVIGGGVVATADGTKTVPVVEIGAKIDSGGVVPATPGASQVALSKLQALSPSRKERLLVREALTLLQFADEDPAVRMAAINRAGEGGGLEVLPALTAVLAKEKDRKIAETIRETISIVELKSPDPAIVRSAAEHLAKLGSSRSVGMLKEAMTRTQDKQLKRDLDLSIQAISRWQEQARWIGNVFSGVSLGSILVLMALGLSVTFGLMGVINMAHGELMMIGAYATYLVQQAFVKWMPAGAYDLYFIAAIPVSFLAAAALGAAIEALLIRHLYGRPLETLLGTWGIGLALIQGVRVIFGDNIAVNSPSWLQGGAEVLRDVTLPYNRCFIIVFCGLCVLGMHLLLSKTRLGLLIRATTQNRTMSSALGVRTRAIDLYTFALGAGLAGLAGCALTQIGGVTPDMGQNYIVDSFLTVVTGGVGKLAGAVWAGLGLGTATKLLEPITQAVWAKVIVLILVVAFLQWKPSGLFPAKGRSLDA
jgi:urea transport system permease protein